MFVFSVPYINIYYLDKADILKIINFSDLKTMPIFIFCLIWPSYKEQAFDSIAGNTVVPYRSLKKFFYYHMLLFTAIYNLFQVEVCICIIMA